MPTSRIASIIIVAALSACTGDTAPPTPNATVDTLAGGGLVVTNPAQGRWSNADRWRIEEALRIGDFEGDGPAVFGELRALEVDPAGRILTFDRMASELRIFSSEGHHLHTFGAPGAGPGEFQNVLGMAAHPAGDLWIVDGRTLRYTVVTPDGAPHSLPRPSRTAPHPWPGGFDAEGRFHDLLTEPADQQLQDFVLRIDAEGEVSERFLMPRIEIPLPQVAPGMSMTLPFAPEVLRAWDPAGGLWQASSAQYRITRLRLSGDTALVIARTLEPRPLAPAQRDSVSAAVEGIEAQFGIRVEPGMVPQAAPTLRWFVPDDRGNLWVCATGLDPCSTLDVFDAAGFLLGTVELPTPVADRPRPVIRGGRMYAAASGPRGEPQLWVGGIVVP
jgi:hypothetical protein